MMKNIRIFGIILLVAVLAVAVAAFACDNFKTKLDNAKKYVTALEKEVENRRRENGWLDRLWRRFGNDGYIDDNDDDLQDLGKWESYKSAQAKLATAKANYEIPSRLRQLC